MAQIIIIIIIIIITIIITVMDLQATDDVSKISKNKQK